MLEAQEYESLFEHIRREVLPDRIKAAKEEEVRSKEALKDNPKAKTNRHHENFLKHWWLLSYGREDMLEALAPLSRYIVCGQVTLRPIFEFIDPRIRPNAALQVFPYEDDYSFGILQSRAHWEWFTNRCSTLAGRPRYTSNTVFDSFPWPQAPSIKEIQAVADAAVALRMQRAALKSKHGISSRELYRTLDLPGASPLKKAQEQLDSAVRSAYGMHKGTSVLPFLLELNQTLALAEEAGKSIQGPGLPPAVAERSPLVTADCVRFE